MLIKITKIVVCVLLAIAVILFIIHEAMPQTHGTDFIVNDYGSSKSANATIEVSDSSVVVDVASDTWTHITNGANDLFTLRDGSKNIDLDSDKLIINQNGIYNYMYRVSLSTSDAEALKLGVAKNSTASVNGTTGFASSSSKNTFGWLGEFVVSDAPDTAYIVIKNTADADDPTIYDAALHFNRVRSN